MDSLQALFPDHSVATLQTHLNRAGGVLDIAVDTILSEPVATVATATVAVTPVHNHRPPPYQLPAQPWAPTQQHQQTQQSQKTSRVETINRAGSNNAVIVLDDDDDDDDSNYKYNYDDHYFDDIEFDDNDWVDGPRPTTSTTHATVAASTSNKSALAPAPAPAAVSTSISTSTPIPTQGHSSHPPANGASSSSAPPSSSTSSSSSSSFNPQCSHHPPPPAPSSFEDFHLEQERIREEQRRKAEEQERERRHLMENFVGLAQDMFENISVAYLHTLMEETRPKVTTQNELVDTCMDVIFELKGKYPRAEVIKGKRKRSDSEDSDGDDDEDFDALLAGSSSANSGSSSSSSAVAPGKPRDFTDCNIGLGGSYANDSARQMYQDFPKISTSTIRTVLLKHKFHYVPAFDFMTTVWKTYQSEQAKITTDSKGKGPAGLVINEVRVVENKNLRKAVGPPNLGSVDLEFAREYQWLRARIAKEVKEAEKIKAEENNLQFYTDMGELVECGCCFDDIPPNRMAQCADGHLFCYSCSRQAAEVELGYQRTVLKCMTSGCTATFTDSEIVKFLAKPVFQGLLRARQQSELKMAGLEGLVECPFCSYAAVIENEDDKEFRCEAPKCKRVSCRLCKEPTHIPQSCEESRKEKHKDNVLTVQHKVEEQMSEALIRECAQCCNKMTCPKCHSLMCYVCKAKIKDYSHFDQTPANSAPKNPKLCRLWDDTVQRNEMDVRAAAQRAVEALHQEAPDLASQVQLDIPVAKAAKQQRTH
ncbi:hypothetical protein BGZ83_001341 [Gryganskiella cystojenkinii]|nr:hypothetical protein BGZ83_001341 [Gryganskiella cystojenkinii]